MNTKQLRKTKFKIILIATILIAAIALLVSLLGRSYLRITVAPDNAVVTVNNKVVKLDSSGYAKAKVTPGTAIIKVAADGYIAYSEQVSFARGRSLVYQISLKKNPTEFQITDDESASDNVQFISDADEDNSIFYLANNGSTLYKAKFELDTGNNITTKYNIPISGPQLSGIKDMIWSPKRDAAIFRKDNSLYTFLDFKKYNFVSQEEVKYGENIGDLAWSPDDSKIAYYYAPAGGEKSLIFANKTNSEMNRVANLAEMGIENPYLSWSPDSEWLIVIPRNTDVATNKIYLFNAYTRSFSTVNDSGGNIAAKFSPDSKKIVYSTISNDAGSTVKQIVSIMDQNGDNKKSLELRAYISKINFLNTDSNKLVVATYNSKTKAESLFLYNIADKSQDGFEIDLTAKNFVKEMSLDTNDEMLYYIANSKFYILSLAK